MEMTVTTETVSERELVLKDGYRFLEDLTDLWNAVFKYTFNWPVKFI